MFAEAEAADFPTRKQGDAEIGVADDNAATHSPAQLPHDHFGIDDEPNDSSTTSGRVPLNPPLDRLGGSPLVRDIVASRLGQLPEIAAAARCHSRGAPTCNQRESQQEDLCEPGKRDKKRQPVQKGGRGGRKPGAKGKKWNVFSKEDSASSTPPVEAELEQFASKRTKVFKMKGTSTRPIFDQESTEEDVPVRMTPKAGPKRGKGKSKERDTFKEIIVTPPAEDDEKASSASEDDRIYCICQQLYDPERMMIACDKCDNWYHNDCVEISEDDVELIDQFMCPICSEGLAFNCGTTWKRKCSRPTCNASVLPLSKYCSDWCGIEVAATRLEKLDISLDSDLLWRRVSGARKPQAAALRYSQFPNAQTEVMDVQSETTQLLRQEYECKQSIIDKRSQYAAQLELVQARMEFLRFAVDRWEAMCIATARALQAQDHVDEGQEGDASDQLKTQKSAVKGKKGKLGAGSSISSAEAPCGFDVRLVWDDRDWKQWIESEEGRAVLEGVEFAGGAEELTRAAEEGVVCLMMKKKCDRHTAWQKTKEADFEAETAFLEKRMVRLADEERRHVLRIEDLEESSSFHAQGLHKPGGVVESMTPQLQVNGVEQQPSADSVISGAQVESEDQKPAVNEESVPMEVD